MTDDTELTITDPDGRTLFSGTSDDIKAAARRLEAGIVPEATLEELEAACRKANDYAESFRDAIKAQAEKYEIEAGGPGPRKRQGGRAAR
jgi:hypothetical protein